MSTLPSNGRTFRSTPFEAICLLMGPACFVENNDFLGAETVAVLPYEQL